MENGRIIKSSEELFRKAVDPTNFISTFILGHLWIEYYLFHIAKITSSKSEASLSKLTHAKLIELIETLQVLSSSQVSTLREINRMRNMLAHDISYEPSIQELETLVTMAAAAFSDMTDGLEQTLEELEGKSALSEVDEFVYPEIFMQITYDLEAIYVKNGGQINHFP